MNTRICYLYRDSDNYKVHNMCVIHGELTDSQIDQILECCDMGEYFIPSQVGLPERKFDEFDSERDHCWFELNRDGFESCNQEADTFLTAEQLTANFQACKNNWRDDLAPNGMEGPAL